MPFAIMDSQREGELAIMGSVVGTQRARTVLAARHPNRHAKVQRHEANVAVQGALSTRGVQVPKSCLLTNQ